MKDRHNKNSKHVALYICQKHFWLYVTSTLLSAKCLLRVCEIKADWYIGSNSRVWNCVSEVREITRDGFLLTPQLVDEIFKD